MLVLLIFIGVSLLMTGLAIMCVIPREELRRARNKQEFEKAVKEVQKFMDS